MQIEVEARLVGLKIALYGVALMLMGVGLANQLQVGDGAATLSAAGSGTQRIVPLVPSLAGALLTLWGAIRLSVLVSPLPLAVTGFLLEIAAHIFPFAAAQLFPEMKTYHWVLPSLLPLFVVRITGLMLFSTAVLRRLVSASRKDAAALKRGNGHATRTTRTEKS
jgi:hypothetical protein